MNSIRICLFLFLSVSFLYGEKMHIQDESSFLVQNVKTLSIRDVNIRGIQCKLIESLEVDGAATNWTVRVNCTDNATNQTLQDSSLLLTLPHTSRTKQTAVLNKDGGLLAILSWSPSIDRQRLEWRVGVYQSVGEGGIGVDKTDLAKTVIGPTNQKWKCLGYKNVRETFGRWVNASRNEKKPLPPQLLNLSEVKVNFVRDHVIEIGALLGKQQNVSFRIEVDKSLGKLSLDFKGNENSAPISALDTNAVVDFGVTRKAVELEFPRIKQMSDEDHKREHTDRNATGNK